MIFIVTRSRIELTRDLVKTTKAPVLEGCLWQSSWKSWWARRSSSPPPSSQASPPPRATRAPPRGSRRQRLLLWALLHHHLPFPPPTTYSPPPLLSKNSIIPSFRRISRRSTTLKWSDQSTREIQRGCSWSLSDLTPSPCCRCSLTSTEARRTTLCSRDILCQRQGSRRRSRWALTQQPRRTSRRHHSTGCQSLCSRTRGRMWRAPRRHRKTRTGSSSANSNLRGPHHHPFHQILKLF